MGRSWESEFIDLQKQVDQLFDELVYRPWASSVQPAWRPLLDFHDTADAYVIDVDLPGVQPADLELRVSERELSIAGQRQVASPEGVLFQKRERPAGTFRRVVAFHEPIVPQKARAECHRGTCRIVLPKKHPAEPEQADVTRQPEQYVIRLTVL